MIIFMLHEKPSLMKLRSLSALFIFFTTFTLSAQDQIILLNGDQIDAKVLEVGDDIRYKRAELLDGPIYVLDKARVRKIVYANGFTETFNGAAADNSSFYAGNTWLRMEGGKYYEGDRPLTKDEFLGLLATQPGTLQTFESGRATLTAGKVVAGLGLVIAVSGYAKALRDGNTAYSGSTAPGVGRLLSGLGIGVVGVVIGSGGARKMKDSVEAYNFQLGRSGHVVPALSSDGVGIVVRF